MPVLQAALILVSAGGLVLTYWASTRLTRVRHLDATVLFADRFTRKQEHEIREAVHHAKLPDDVALHGAAIMWAREETTYGPYTWIWMLWQPVGIAVAISALYLIPGVVIDIIVGSVQLVIVLAGLAGISYSRRGIGPAQSLLDSHPELVNNPGKSV